MPEILPEDDNARYYSLREAFNGQIQNQRDETARLTGHVTNLQSSVATMFNKLDSLAEKMEANRKPNFALIALLCTIVLAIIPGIWFVINNSVANSIAPVTSRLAQVEVGNTERDARLLEVTRSNNEQSRDISNLLRDATAGNSELHRDTDSINKISEHVAASTAADSASVTDRAQLNERVRAMETTMAATTANRSGQVAEINARLLEIEQQFHASSNIENMRWSQQNRENSMTFEKLHPGEHYPTSAFFPSSIFQATPTDIGR